MKITKLEINNFRGIKKCDINFPIDSRLICLIGSGDSTKTTLLKAIEWILYPAWNLSPSDNDFYNRDVSEKMILRGTFTEIPDALLLDDKFGLYLRSPYAVFQDNINDEPQNGDAICLTIQLEIDSTLEPKWSVVCNRNEGKPISHLDRRLFSIGIVGNDCDKDMLWGRSSVLQKYADSRNVLHGTYTEVLRQVANNAELSELNKSTPDLLSIGKQYGVKFASDINNKLTMYSGSFSTTVGLFDGETPLSQRGLGSQRLLSMGLNIDAVSGESLLLIDEIENSLEPYRLRNLIHELKAQKEISQTIFTTHSPVTVAECNISDIFVIQSKENSTLAHQMLTDDAKLNNVIQAQLRKNSESFLSKRIIICEGKTEIGFIRALDRFLLNTKQFCLAYEGITTADGGGDTVFSCAEILKSCGYDICIFMDSDLSEKSNEKELLRKRGISIFDWNDGYSIEEQIFEDVSDEIMNDLLKIAIEEKGIESVINKLKSSEIKYTNIDNDINFGTLNKTVKKQIGTIAKNKGAEWYKRIDLGERLGEVVFGNYNNIDENSKLHKTIDEIIKWVTKND